MNPRFRLDVFEGPLDLLLHLIKKHEVDLYDIPIAIITEQYLQYLEGIEDLNLDLAGEYLVMAAALVQIKARMLLPSDESEEEDDEDPRADLVRQLEEYQRYKAAAEELAGRPQLGRDVFRREADDSVLGDHASAPLAPHAVEQLIHALREVIRRVPERTPHPVARERVSLADRVRVVLERLRRGPAEFGELFADSPTRQQVVVTFLALLELVRRQIVLFRQAERFGPIELRLGADVGDEVVATVEDEYGE